MYNNSYKLLKYIKDTWDVNWIHSDREMSKSWEPTNLGGSLGEMCGQMRFYILAFVNIYKYMVDLLVNIYFISSQRFRPPASYFLNCIFALFCKKNIYI